jgi:hypothetical protein
MDTKKAEVRLWASRGLVKGTKGQEQRRISSKIYFIAKHQVTAPYYN